MLVSLINTEARVNKLSSILSTRFDLNDSQLDF